MRKSQRFNSFHAGVHGFDERCLLERNAIRDTDHAVPPDDPIHHANILGEAPATGFVACRRPNFLVGRTLGKHLVPAVIAVAARDVMEDHHPVANPEAGNAVANRSNNAGGLVAKDPGSGVRAGGDFLQICAADAAGMDADEDLASADLRHRNGLHADVVDAPIDRGQHGRRDGRLLDVLPS
jgi:hypothetical protein